MESDFCKAMLISVHHELILPTKSGFAKPKNSVTIVPGCVCRNRFCDSKTDFDDNYYDFSSPKKF